MEQLVERYARRARRVQSAGEQSPSTVSVSYIAVGEVARPMALRRILDKQLTEVHHRLAAQKLSITLTDEAREAILAVGYALGLQAKFGTGGFVLPEKKNSQKKGAAQH